MTLTIKPRVHYVKSRRLAIRRARKFVEDNLAKLVNRKEPRPWLCAVTPGAYGNRSYYSSEIHVLEGSPQRGVVIVLNGSEASDSRLVYAFDGDMNKLAEWIIDPQHAEEMEKWEREDDLNEPENR